MFFARRQVLELASRPTWQPLMKAVAAPTGFGPYWTNGPPPLGPACPPRGHHVPGGSLRDRRLGPHCYSCWLYPRAQRWFFFGQYIIIPKKKISHNQKGTTLQPLGKLLARQAPKGEVGNQRLFFLQKAAPRVVLAAEPLELYVVEWWCCEVSQTVSAPHGKSSDQHGASSCLRAELLP